MTHVVCEETHTGSRTIAVVCRDAHARWSSRGPGDRTADSTGGLDSERLAPLHDLDAEGKTHALTRAHPWHLEVPDRRHRVCRVDRHGVPLLVPAAGAPVQPGTKVRGGEYPRIVHGPDHTAAVTSTTIPARLAT